jgi:hypothetical protein
MSSKKFHPAKESPHRHIVDKVTKADGGIKPWQGFR